MATDKSSRKADVVGWVEALLLEAAKAAASDVHFEPMADKMLVRYRLDGQLKVVEEIPRTLAENVVSRLKVLANLLTYRNDIPQEGRIELPGETGGDLLEQRLAVFPTIYGQRAVVRLFYKEANLVLLKQLGFSEAIYQHIRDLTGKNQGVILITGPAGSGKSTTLGAILRDILERFPGKSIVSLEDPVERRIDGISQVQIPPHGEMTFPMALRSLLRQDPQVLMIGEIRDAETARIAIESGLTGHLLLSTLHSGTPAAALLRLLEMGIEPYQLTSSIAAVLNQRLLRRLCPTCKKPAGQSVEFEAVGCPNCFETGYKGRILVAELVELDGQLRKALLSRMDLDELTELLRQRGHMTLRQDGRRLVACGLTSREELDLVCGADEAIAT